MDKISFVGLKMSSARFREAHSCFPMVVLSWDLSIFMLSDGLIMYGDDNVIYFPIVKIRIIISYSTSSKNTL